MARKQKPSLTVNLGLVGPLDMERLIAAFHEREDLAMDLDAANERIAELERAIHFIGIRKWPL
jgi:hypothetical protein